MTAAEAQTMCEYFAWCNNPADGTTDHPILGEVPTCQQCADKFGLKLILFYVAGT